MRGSLREKIGEGAASDVYVWAPGQVVKLFKADIPERFVQYEARVTRAVFAAGAPAPEVFEEVALEGRFGIVLARLSGPTLLHLSRTGTMRPGETGALLASLCLSVHRIAPPPEVPTLRDFMQVSLSRGNVPEHIVKGVLALIDRVQPGDKLCHADLHPGNVIMTENGPKIIDWLTAVRAPAVHDLACCHILLTDLGIFADDPRRPRAINAAAQAEYARLINMPEPALTAAMESYLPIARARMLQGGAVPSLRDQLIRSIEMALRPL